MKKAKLIIIWGIIFLFSEQIYAQSKIQNDVNLNMIIFINDNLVVNDISVITMVANDSTFFAKYYPGNVKVDVVSSVFKLNAPKIMISFKYFDVKEKSTDTRKYEVLLGKYLLFQDYLIIRFYDMNIKKYRKKYKINKNENYVYSIESPELNMFRK